MQVLFRAHTPAHLGFATFDVPVRASIDVAALALAVLAAVCLFKLNLGVLKTLGITAAAGLVLRFAMNL